MSTDGSKVRLLFLMPLLLELSLLVGEEDRGVDGLENDSLSEEDKGFKSGGDSDVEEDCLFNTFRLLRGVISLEPILGRRLVVVEADFG